MVAHRGGHLAKATLKRLHTKALAYRPGSGCRCSGFLLPGRVSKQIRRPTTLPFDFHGFEDRTWNRASKEAIEKAYCKAGLCAGRIGPWGLPAV